MGKKKGLGNVMGGNFTNKKRMVIRKVRIMEKKTPRKRDETYAFLKKREGKLFPDRI